MQPSDPALETIDPDTFFQVDIRLGEIVEAEPFPQARKPAYKLVIDFGPGIGTRRSSAQITELYELEALRGRKVLGVVNFPPRQIGPFMSEVLVLGVHDNEGRVALLNADGDAPIGARVC